eukprot:5332673-Amphidinium_carterae.1
MDEAASPTSKTSHTCTTNENRSDILDKDHQKCVFDSTLPLVQRYDAILVVQCSDNESTPSLANGGGNPKLRTFQRSTSEHGPPNCCKFESDEHIEECSACRRGAIRKGQGHSTVRKSILTPP